MSSREKFDNLFKTTSEGEEVVSVILSMSVRHLAGQ